MKNYLNGMYLTSPSYCNVLITLDKKQTAKKIIYK